ncbi:MAG: Trk system potassium transporter TrkA [Candidatus Zixiibacteriota bacterium]|nr:MAG: Trk system potassium transporter TrkA [candidate division Zixibacteria bacterium]
MQIVIIGMGEVGKHLAAVLAGEDHDVTIIDSNADILEAAEDRIDVRAIRGNGASFRTLRDAEADKADLVAAVTNDDEANIVASLQAKELGAQTIIARVDSHEYLPGWQGAYHEILGIDLVISPRILAAIQVNKLIRSFGAVSVANFADDRVQMVQLPVGNTEICNIALKDLETPGDILVAAILRGDEMIIPSGLDMILPDDEIFVIGKTDKIAAAEAYFGKARTRGARSIVILGGGEIGFAVARSLEKQNFNVRIIEWNPRVCEYLSEALSEATIINGDGTDLELLEEEKVGDADVFVAASKRDEVNLMAGLLVQNLGVKKTIALVHRPDYIKIYEHLGLDATISPRRFAANQILKYVRAGKVLSVSEIAEGKGEILEFVAPRKSKIIQNDLKNIGFPRGAVVGAIAGKRGILVPTGNDRVHAGDSVIIFSTPEVRSKVEELFKQ